MKIPALCDLFGDKIVWNILCILYILVGFASVEEVFAHPENTLKILVAWMVWVNIIYTMKKHIIPLIEKL